MDIHLHMHDDVKIDLILARLAHLLDQGATHMALTQAVRDRLEAIKATLESGVAGIKGDIQDLKDKITSSAGATEAEILAGLDSIGASVQAVGDLDLENPAAPVTPVDPPVDPPVDI